jgi:hypothetical protein
MTILNAPTREFCVARRERTNTPLQALLLMNEQEYFKAAKACAIQVRKDTGGDEEKGLHRLYEKVTSQEADAERMHLLQGGLKEFRDMYANDQALVDALAPELKDTPAAERVEVAAWTMMAHSLFNLELTKVRR